MEENDEEVDEVVGKKRKGNKDMWGRNIVKKLRLTGKEYVNSKGENIPAKSTGVNCR